MNSGYIHSIRFTKAPCYLADVIKKRLCEYRTLYQTQGISTDWKYISHNMIEYEIKSVEPASDRVSLDIYITIRCTTCRCVLNEDSTPIRIGKWFNLCNINHYKQLLEHNIHRLDINLPLHIDMSKIYLEIVKILHDNLKNGDVLEDFEHYE